MKQLRSSLSSRPSSCRRKSHLSKGVHFVQSGLSPSIIRHIHISFCLGETRSAQLNSAFPCREEWKYFDLVCLAQKIRVSRESFCPSPSPPSRRGRRPTPTPAALRRVSPLTRLPPGQAKRGDKSRPKQFFLLLSLQKSNQL